ncbi:MAG: response regulator [Bacteroidales bacterium]|nr:response regulator [Bacteroidales bacterium]
MKLYYTVLLFTVLLFSAGIAHSQEILTAPESLPFVKYTDKDGLSNSHINAVGQDEKGFIWIATNDGLNRFDGKNFETFYYFPSDSGTVNSNVVFTIFNDKDNKIWFGTFSGLCSYDYKSGKFETIDLPPQPNAIKKFPVRGIVQISDGSFYLALSGGGLAHWDKTTNNVKYYRHNASNSNSLCSDALLSMTLDKDGNIWIGSEDNGISIFDLEEKTFTNISKSSGKIGSDVINTLYCTKDGKVVIGTYDSGFTIYNPENKEFKTFDECRSVFSVSEGNKNNLWIGSGSNGLYFFDLATEKLWNFSCKSGNAIGLISDNIHAVFTDRDQNIWLGVFQGGINLLKPKPMFSGAGTRNGVHLSGISQKPVLGICCAGNDTVYLGTDGDGINVWNTKNHSFEHLRAGKNGLTTNVIRCIHRDHDGRIWVGTYLKGLSEYHPKTKTFTLYENNPDDLTTLSHNDVTAITEDRLGNLWIGTNGGGLNLMDTKTGSFKVFKKDNRNPENSLINNHVVSLYIDKHGYLWIGTYWGLSRMDPVRYEFKNFDVNDDYNSYNCMFEDSKQRFWAGTNNGLKLINTSDGSFQMFTTKDGLANNVVNAIEEDSHGNLWLSTNKGISKFDYEDKTFISFSSDDGLFSNEFIHNSSDKSPSGEMFFGGIDGVTKFMPDDIKNSGFVPGILLTDFLVFNKSVQPGAEDGILKNTVTETSELTLEWKDNSFTIVYTAIDYRQPQKVVYSCRMRGFNDNWINYDWQKNSSTFTNLDAGVYYFEVKASVDGENFSKPAILKITVLAPLWKRWHTILLYFVTAFGLITWLWKKYREYENEKHENKIRYLKQQNDIELNKTRLRLFTDISHEFKTPLTLIISPLEGILSENKIAGEEKETLSLIHRNAQRLLKMVNEIMDLRKLDNDKVVFKPSKGDLVGFVREIYENFYPLAQENGTEFIFESDLKEFHAYFDKEQIDKVFYNLLSNAFKFTPKDGKISVQIKKADELSPENIVVIIEDNGSGIAEENIDKIFDRFFQGGTSQMQQGTGIGLYLTKKYVEMHHGIISVSSSLDKGTAFTVMLSSGKDFKEKAIENSNYSHQQIITDTELPLPKKTVSKSLSAQKNTVLIIEDNAEIRSYLSGLLQNDYEIKTAVNGKLGLETIKQTLPDIVITDIMMPELDGIELTKIIKNDLETCHIPVIMLTAKGTEQQRIEGLETGADSYIPKPFNPKHVLVRVEKLLELRKALKEKFSSEISFEAEQTAVTVPDRDLLKKVTSVIKTRLSDPQLSVETLSEEVGLSRGHLQRKLKNLTGQNPNEFIRIIRLKQAAEILIEKDVTVSEVADMVGFSSQSYFSTAFTKQFNISPSQYVENNRKG